MVVNEVKVQKVQKVQVKNKIKREDSPASGSKRGKKIFDIVDLPQKERNFADLCEIVCIYQKKAVLLQSQKFKQQKLTDMEASVKQAPFDWRDSAEERPLIDPDWKSKPKYSEEEFWNMAYVDLGKRYGVNDIREAK